MFRGRYAHGEEGGGCESRRCNFSFFCIILSYFLYYAILLRAVSISDLNGIVHFNKVRTESALPFPFSSFISL